MNILTYKKSNKVYFDSLSNGDIFIFNDKVYMKVSNKMMLKDGKTFTTIKICDFCVNLETGRAMEISGGTFVEPLDKIEIKKE